VKFDVGTDTVKFYVDNWTSKNTIKVYINDQLVISKFSEYGVDETAGFTAFGIGFTAYVSSTSSNLASIYINNQANVLLNNFSTQKTYLFGNIRAYTPASGNIQISIPSLHYT